MQNCSSPTSRRSSTWRGWSCRPRWAKCLEKTDERPFRSRSMNAPLKRRRRWPWVLLGIAILAGVMFKMGAGRSAPKDLDGSLIVPVKKGDLPIEVIETGKVQPREKVEVKSKVAGQVEKVFVEEGAQVKKGEPLLRIDSTD